MKIVFLSNQLTPHQIPFCDSMSRLTEKNFEFIQFDPAKELWAAKGQTVCRDNYEYLHFYHEEKGYCEEIILDADVVIIGSVDLSVIKRRLDRGKLVFVYLERFYKKGIHLRNIVRVVGGTFLHHGRFQRYKPYLLCAGGYCSGDAAIFGNYKAGRLKWGYFPETKVVNLPKLMESKKENTIVWAGRLIDWKHPDDMLLAAKKLKERGYRFQLKIFGDGAMRNALQEMADQYDLCDCVTLYGNVPNQVIRREMEKATIYVATSDYQEGWGCVINEAMNSACAVVASHAMGAVPFLVRDGENGLVYKSGNVDELAELCAQLLCDPQQCYQLGCSAYETIIREWNEQTAAERIIGVSEKILAGQNDFYVESGPCSVAEPIRQNMVYERIKKRG